MNVSSDEINTFVDAQVALVEKAHETVLANAAAFHAEHCEAPEKYKAECMRGFMTEFTRLFGEAVAQRASEKYKKAYENSPKILGIIIR